MTWLRTSRQVRSGLYRSARALGDVNAVGSGRANKVVKRAARRVVGRQVGRAMRSLLR